MIAAWKAPLPDGSLSEELLIGFDRARDCRVLVLPAWFDEANKLRRFTLEAMRRLDRAGVDSFLPDLPGCNESLAPLALQTLANWRAGAELAVQQWGITHVLAMRAGALIAPAELPGWRYASQTGPQVLRHMVRARILAAREDGLSETSEALHAKGRAKGLLLGGWMIGPQMFAALESADPPPAPLQLEITAPDLGGAGLWLRAEPGEDTSQADRLAEIIRNKTGDAS